MKITNLLIRIPQLKHSYLFYPITSNLGIQIVVSPSRPGRQGGTDHSRRRDPQSALAVGVRRNGKNELTNTFPTHARPVVVLFTHILNSSLEMPGRPADRRGAESKTLGVNLITAKGQVVIIKVAN